jgi:transcriptional regulator with XRE-family HTH domain
MTELFTGDCASEFTAPELAQILDRAIGSTVRRLREMRDISQSELARRADLHADFVNRVERGGAQLGTLALARIFLALGYTATDVLCELATHIPLHCQLARNAKQASA